jgi:negative regulator of flagellin synthesis FlgM
MKIPISLDISGSAAALRRNDAAKPGAGAPASASATASQSTRSSGVAVTVSTQAQSLKKLPASQTGDIDMAKVAAVKSAIQEGTYVVNPEAIADKLLSNAQEMLNRTSN